MDSPSAQEQGDPSAKAAAAESGGARGRTTFEQSASRDEGANTNKGPVAVERLWRDVDALRAELALLFAARRDQVKLALRRAFVLAVVVGLALVALAMLAAAACVMLIVGIAGGVGELVGSAWLGQLLTGLGFIFGGVALGWALIRMARQRSRRKTLERYGKIQR